MLKFYNILRRITKFFGLFFVFITFCICGAPLPLRYKIKRWPAGPAVPSSSLARGEIFSTVNRFLSNTAFLLSLSTSHRPDMTEILFQLIRILKFAYTGFIKVRTMLGSCCQATCNGSLKCRVRSVYTIA